MSSMMYGNNAAAPQNDQETQLSEYIQTFSEYCGSTKSRAAAAAAAAAAEAATDRHSVGSSSIATI